VYVASETITVNGREFVYPGTFTMNGSASVSGNTASSYYVYGGGVYVDSGTFTMNGNATVSGNTASSSNYSSNGGGVYVKSGNFIINGGTVYGSDGGANANKLEGGKTQQGVSLYDTTATTKYGDGSLILPFGTLYTDDTLTGHN
jgi:hypothetical protein